MENTNPGQFGISFTPAESQYSSLSGGFEMPDKGNNLLDPISGMLQSGSDMDWATWDKMVLQYHNPDNMPSSWGAGLDNFDFSSLPELGPITSDSWGTVPSPNRITSLPGAGIMPFQFNPNGAT